jgi:hypothetical protein
MHAWRRSPDVIEVNDRIAALTVASVAERDASLRDRRVAEVSQSWMMGGTAA